MGRSTVTRPMTAAVGLSVRNIENNQVTLPQDHLSRCPDNYTDMEYRRVDNLLAIEQKLKRRQTSVDEQSRLKRKNRNTVACFHGISSRAERNQLVVTHTDDEKKTRVLLGKNVACASLKGARDYQEDTCTAARFTLPVKRVEKQFLYHALFDGHGGKDCSQFLKSRMLTLFKTRLEQYIKHYGGDLRPAMFNAFKIAFTDAHFEAIKSGEGTSCGSTATVAVVINHGPSKDRELWVAATGDSPAMLVTPYRKVIPLSEDASLDNPLYMESAEKRGLFRMEADCRYLSSLDSEEGINMTRSLGDGDCAAAISARPKVVRMMLPQESSQKHLLVQGSDGLFELIRRYDMGLLAHKLFTQARNPSALDIASTLVDVSDETTLQHLKITGEPDQRDNKTALVSIL
ncbi:PP2C family serine/threonine-protein phosphatase [Parendozoicomonas haliclonae]|uniref:Protein phosphatase 2C n=1 Tax=Parendozoicomonas haliclonae TaxID=1960125 RepID=A0A1X7AP15_9GAMM|nr:PP2C family protein-serine/threonine phosphatase [Parendozoicomonas haliclonae]SMA50026.1 Protein phosphatase 2C [Parendozoicomonas haliclonae]